jgi:predicted ATP-grasp superfamily ATP-dependent carboligase
MFDEQSQHKPVLILAQSGRFLAQSATQAGFTVWVADCYGDIDTRQSSSRWALIPPNFNISSLNLLTILSELSQNEDCYLAYGSGIESVYSILDILPPNIELIGNSFNTLNDIFTPQTFFQILDNLAIPYPTTQFSPPTHPNEEQPWLQKSARGYGGSHISYYLKGDKSSDNYFQHYIEGDVASILFLKNHHCLTILSINKQLNHSENFRFEGIETPYAIPKKTHSLLISIIKQLCALSGLIGLNSLDFIVTPNKEIMILEINPRPSASLELINIDVPIFQLHLNACLGFPSLFTVSKRKKTSLRYLFSDDYYATPNNIEWPLSCHDRPQAHTTLKPGHPICSSLVTANSLEIEALHSRNDHFIKNQLLKLESE